VSIKHLKLQKKEEVSINRLNHNVLEKCHATDEAEQYCKFGLEDKDHMILRIPVRFGVGGWSF